MPLTPKQKFIKWFVRPYNRLKRVEGGDGAFVALAMGFQLCERFYRIKSHTITDHRSNAFLKPAAKAYNVDHPFFHDFWFLYRHGIQHQGSPKRKVRVLGSNPARYRRYKWAIDARFPERPVECVINNKKAICIDPWKFTAFMLRKFLQNPKELEKSVSHAFGDIFPIPDDTPWIEHPH